MKWQYTSNCEMPHNSVDMTAWLVVVILVYFRWYTPRCGGCYNSNHCHTISEYKINASNLKM